MKLSKKKEKKIRERKRQNMFSTRVIIKICQSSSDKKKRNLRNENRNKVRGLIKHVSKACAKWTRIE